MNSGLHELADAIDDLSRLLRSEGRNLRPRLDVILDAYLDTRRRLTLEMGKMAASHYVGALSAVQEALRNVEEAVRKARPDILDETERIAGYQGVHGILLSYMLENVGRPITAEKLRLLVGDQVHTERRLRDLRELGFKILAVRALGRPSYVLSSGEQDLSSAVNLQVRRLTKRQSKRKTARGGP